MDKFNFDDYDDYSFIYNSNNNGKSDSSPEPKHDGYYDNDCTPDSPYSEYGSYRSKPGYDPHRSEMRYDARIDECYDTRPDRQDPVRRTRRRKKRPLRSLIKLIMAVLLILLIYFFPGRRAVTDDISSFISGDDFATELSSETESDAEFTGQEDLSQTAPDPSSLEEASVIPFYEIRYELLQLDDNLLKNFCALYTAISNFETECLFPCSMKADDIQLLCELVNSECPELFQADPYNVSYKTNIITQNVISCTLKYNMNEEEYRQCWQKCNDLIWSISSGTAGMNDYEKEMYVYRYFADNCIYDDTSSNSSNAFGALIENRAKCEGISKAVKWVLENMNITCLCTFGDSPEGTEGHMWNTVQLNGAFYDLDVTADIHRENEDKDMLYSAVNVSDTWIRSRYIMNGSAAARMNIPCTTNMNQSYHALNGRLIHSGESYDTLVQNSFHDIYTQGGGSFFIQFEDPDTFRKFISDAGDSDTLVSWFTASGCRSRSFSSEIRYSEEYNTCRLKITFK